jgi:hypothetical protein
MFQNKEKSISLKTMEDGQVMLYSVRFNFLHPIFFHFDFCKWHCVMVFHHLSSVNGKEANKITELSFYSLLFQSSVNGKEAKIPLPWLVFNEKMKVNSVFLRDSTAIPDSVLLLFGGNLQQGGLVSSFCVANLRSILPG